MSKLVIHNKKSKKRVPTKSAPEATPEIAGRLVQFEQDGQRLYGVVKSLVSLKEGERGVKLYSVDVAVPDSDGVLHRSGSLITLDDKLFDVDSTAAISDEERKIKAWAADVAIDATKLLHTPLHMDEDETKPVLDWLNVSIEGFLSTFIGTTPADRDGDFVHDSAFDKTLPEFRRNPVLLTDHENRVKSLAGSFDKIGINPQGLAFSAKISNAPDVRSTRFKIVEGHLKTTSMGGLFFFDDTGRGIEEVTLWEGSLTPVPANPDALFQVRSLTALDAVKAMKSIRR